MTVTEAMKHHQEALRARCRAIANEATFYVSDPQFIVPPIGNAVRAKVVLKGKPRVKHTPTHRMACSQIKYVLYPAFVCLTTLLAAHWIARTPRKTSLLPVSDLFMVTTDMVRSRHPIVSHRMPPVRA